MQTAVKLPKDLLALTGMAAVGRAAQRALEQALADDLEPIEPDSGAHRTTIYLSPALESMLLLAAIPAREFGPTTSALIHAWAIRERTRRAATIVGTLDFGSVNPSTLRPRQRKLIEQVLPRLEAGRIVFQEASTGIGKGRALATLAHLRQRAGQQVTLATPSVALMVRLLDEFAALALPAPAIYLGRAHFIDKGRLDALLQDPALELPDVEREAAAAWDGHPTPGSPTARLAAQLPSAAWLREDLVRLAPSIPMDEVAFGEGEHEGYDALREAWLNAPVRLTTHALLAVDMRLQRFGKGIVGTYGCLLIDEAHLFEEAVGRAFSAGMSLQTIRIWLRRATGEHRKDLAAKRCGAAAARVLVAVEEVMDVFAAETKPGDYTLAQVGLQLPGPAAAILKHVTDLAERIGADLKALASSGVREAGLLEESVRACGNIRAGHPVIVQVSPVRRYPSIMVGPRGLGKSFEALWGRTTCAALLSGTLMVDTSESGISAGYYASLLHVPQQRLAELPRIVEPWLYSDPVVHIPDLPTALKLVPPAYDEDVVLDERDGPEEDAYHSEIAKLVRLASKDAAGGTLVLCTSYRAVQALTAHLADLQGRVIEQRRAVAFGTFERAFRVAARSGSKPVWIATGQAWTGLDLRDEQVEASQDRLLTDLIITRLPVVRARSVHGALRDARAGLYMARLDTSFRFRQGIGRLMRAKGQPDRRLWIGDGRLWSSEKPNPYLCGPSLRAIKPYRHVTKFSLA